VRLIARLLHEADLSEIEIETVHPSPASTSGDTSPSAPSAPAVRLQLRRGSKPSIARRVAAPVSISATPSTSAPLASHGTSTSTSGDIGAATTGEWEVLSPAVGLFRALEPPLAVGDEVKAGQKAGAVEALKVPTDILFERAGRITQVLAEDNIGVEYAQTLFVVLSDE
jgi:biotin carboxyl carrier protein